MVRLHIYIHRNIALPAIQRTRLAPIICNPNFLSPTKGVCTSCMQLLFLSNKLTCRCLEFAVNDESLEYIVLYKIVASEPF